MTNVMTNVMTVEQLSKFDITNPQDKEEWFVNSIINGYKKS